MAGATPEQLKQIKNEAEEAADNDPVDLQTLDNFNDIYDDSSAPGYFHFLMNPSDMDEGWLRNGQYAAIGTAVVAGGAAIALKAAAVYGISQIGAVSLSRVPAQIALEYRLIAAGGAVGSQTQQRYFGQFDSAKYPKPPGWTPQWVWGPSSGSRSETWRWWDPHGGEWRFHFADKHHLFDHWDFNAWTIYNSPWQNVYFWN